ncbi:MAG: hypothetical protein VXX55_09390 [Planctomycetota bacterium]|nr:hypothetical protein [Planctomycetota bacterium]MEC8306076.1 hypothetical protein [Planctomycetota bacterium]MEC8800964.1 hypothetical protein [Planctomycetota bacterium]
MTAITTSDRANDFELLAAPFLSKFCVTCHNSIDPQGKLDLSNAEGWKAGGTSGENPWNGKLTS